MDQSQPNLNAPPFWREPWRLLLLALLAGSAALRAVLVLRGGQFFWSDESRYDVSRDAIACLARQDYAGFAQKLLGGADHLFFKVLGLLPAGIEHWTGESALIPGLFCAGFSVLNIHLLWRIALAAGASTREAGLAALLLAGACTNFFYARHIFPYDAALTFGLLSLWAGWSGGGGWRRSFGCGLLSSLAFLTYNGSWLFGAMVLLGHVLHAGPELKPAGRRALFAGLGLVLPIGLVIGLAHLLGVDLLASFLQFSQTVNQGDFGGGWRLMGEYFWTAEGWNLFFGLLGLLLVGVGAVAARRWSYGVNWLVGAVFVLTGLLVFSDVWHKFVIYGRTAREIVPLVCLASAFALERLWRTGGRAARLAHVVVILVVAQAVVNLSGPLQQFFPAEFRALAAEQVKQLRKNGDRRQMVVLYADHLAARESIFESLPDHHVVLARSNPMQFVPYQMEGWDENFRRFLKKHDVRMQLIAVNQARFNHPTQLRQPFPGVVQLTLRLPQKPVGNEPLVVTGTTGRGDLVYLIYDSPTSIRLGFDHWSVGGFISDPVTVDYNKPVEIILSMGPLHGEALPETAVQAGTDLRHWLYAEVNGLLVWSIPADFHPAAATSISYGLNYIGGSTCGTRFTGAILKVQSLLLPAIPPYPTSLRQPHPGVVQLTLRLPKDKKGVREPLVVTGKAGSGDVVYVHYDSPTSIRLGFDHWSVGGGTSDAIPVDYSKPVVITLSTGPLHGPAAAASVSGQDWRRWLYADVNGQVALSQPADFHDAPPDSIAFGANNIGASSALSKFTGTILRIESLAPEAAPRLTPEVR